MKFKSKEWLDACVEKMDTDPTHLKDASKLTVKWCNIVLDSPDGTDKFEAWDIKNGKCLNLRHEEKPAPSDFRTLPFDKKEFDYMCTATYEVLAKLHRGELTAMQALRNPAYKIQGSRLKLLMLTKALSSWNEVQKAIPTEY